MKEIQENTKVKESNKILVATYGTLRKNQGNYRHILKPSPTAKYLGTTKTEPKYRMYSLGGFPGVLEGGDQSITVDVFSVEDEETKARLDMLEGYNGEENRDHNFYNKILIPTEFGEAEFYIYNSQPSESYRIPSGDWLNR